MATLFSEVTAPWLICGANGYTGVVTASLGVLQRSLDGKKPPRGGHFTPSQLMGPR